MLKGILRDIKDIHSVSVKEGRLLYKLAKEYKGVIVEIGSWKGYSTIWLAKGSQAGECVKVCTIDPHTGSEVHREMYGVVGTYPELIENITKANVGNIVVPMVMTSEQAEKQWGDLPIELLWIDGDHEDIENDIIRWYPHLSLGGIIALHDTVAWASMLPYKVAIREIYKSGNFADIKRVGRITYARKVKTLSNGNKLGNRVALYIRCIYQVFIPYYTRCLILGAKCLGRIR